MKILVPHNHYSKDHLDDVIGRELVVDVTPGTAVQWDLIR